MTRVGLIFAGLAGMLLLAAFLGPMLYDWSRFKPEIEARLEQALGREVRIQGPVALSLIPGPRFSAADLTIANAPGGSDPVMAHIRRLRLNLALLPLFSGQVKIDSLTLDEPTLLLEQIAGRQPNWVFGAAARVKPAVESGAAREGRGTPIPPPVGEAEQPTDIGVDRMVIREGSVTYRPAEGQPVRLAHVGAEIRASTLHGPFDAKGSMVAGGVPVAFSAAAGTLAPDRGTPLSLELRLQRVDAMLRFSGLLSHLSQGPVVRGKLSASTPRLDEAFREMGIGAVLPLPARAKANLDGEMQASGKEITVNALTLRIGETLAKGALTVLPQEGPQIDLAVALPNLNLDKWLAGDSAASGQIAPANAETARPPAGVPTGRGGAAPAPQPAGLGFALPAGLDATVDLSAEGVVWRGQALRQVSLHFGVQGGKVLMHQGLALLPAGSELRFNGTFDDPTASAGRGALEMRSDNLRGLLSWLGMAVPEVPADRLRRFTLAAAWRTSGDLISLSDVDASLDTSRLTGAGTIRLGDRLSFGLDASVDSINVDAYRGPPEPARTQPEAPGAAPGQAPQANAAPARTETALAPAEALTAGLAGLDAEVKLDVKQVLWDGAVASGLFLDGTLWNGKLRLREASVADLAGASVRLSGDVDGLAGNPTLTAVNVNLTARQPARLLRVFDLGGGTDWTRLGQVGLKGTLSGPLDKLTVEAGLAAGSGSLAASGQVVGLPGAPAAELALDLRHPSFAQLAAMLSESYRPGAVIGAVALKATLVADIGRMSLSGIDGQIGGMALGGKLLADWSARPRIEADLTAGDIPIDSFLPGKSTASLRRRGAAIEPIAAPAPSAGIQARPAVISAAAPASTGGAPWSSVPVDLAGLAAFDGRLGLSAKSATWEGTVFNAPVLALTLTEGRATLERLEAGLYGGKIGLTGILAALPSPSLSAQLAIDGAEVREAMKSGGGIAVTGGKLDAQAEFATSGASTEDWAKQLSGQGRLTVREGTVSGFDLPEVNRRLANIENVAGILGLVQSGLSGGQTQFQSLAGTFQARAGIVTSDDLRLQADGGMATATVRIDLPRYLLDARTGIRLAASPDAPPLGIRLEGPLDAPRKFVDINDLQRYLLTKGLGRALKSKGAEGLLQGLLGGGSRGAAPEPAEPEATSRPEAVPPGQGAETPSRSKTPEDFVRELLKGLGR